MPKNVRHRKVELQYQVLNLKKNPHFLINKISSCTLLPNSKVCSQKKNLLTVKLITCYYISLNPSNITVVFYRDLKMNLFFLSEQEYIDRSYDVS